MKELLKKYFLDIYKLYEEYINPALAKLMKFSGYGAVEKTGEGSWVTDHLGRKWLDCCSCYGAISLGHRHPKIVEVAVDQLTTKLGLSTKVFFNEYQALLAKRLAEITPGDLQYCFFSNSGAEANEGAIKLAFAANPKKHKIVATYNSFHGKTAGALAVTGREQYRAPFQSLLMQEVLFINFNDVNALRTAFDKHGDDIAALIVETIQGEGGIHIATLAFLQMAQQCCKQHGTAFIVDEVQTGFGRTGKMLGIDHYPGVEPDIMTFAKALGGGIIPIGAMISTKKIFGQAYGDKSPTIHTSTFGGNPLACRIALTTIDIIENEDLREQAHISGKYVLLQLDKLWALYPNIILEVRGCGLLIGIELADEGCAGMLISEMSKKQIIVVYTNNQPKVIRVEPPLNISRVDIDHLLLGFQESLAKIQAYLIGQN